MFIMIVFLLKKHTHFSHMTIFYPTCFNHRFIGENSSRQTPSCQDFALDGPGGDCPQCPL